jgi:hypothetical protein
MDILYRDYINYEIISLPRLLGTSNSQLKEDINHVQEA